MDAIINLFSSINENITTVIGLVTLIVIIWQSFIYNQQAKLLREQVLNMSISDSAYVGIHEIKNIQILVEGKPLELDITFVNGGKTPAWNFRSYFRVVLSDKELKEVIEKYPINFVEGTGSFLISGQKRAVGVISSGLEFSSEQIRSVKSKEKKIFLLCEIRFDNFLKQKQALNFYIAYNYSSGTWEEQDFPY